MPQDIKKARKHQETELQGSNLDLIKICNWDGDIWNSLDGSNEEASKAKSVIKQEVITDRTFGNEPERWNTTKVHYFNTDTLWKIQITSGISQWLYQLWCDRAEKTPVCDRGKRFRPSPCKIPHPPRRCYSNIIDPNHQMGKWGPRARLGWGSVLPRQGPDELRGECHKQLS